MDVDHDANTNAAATTATTEPTDATTVQGKVTGLILPPPDLRKIVDKTAEFVARSGRTLERRIAGETGSARFSFLKDSDPYHAYYEHQVRVFTEKIEAKKQADAEAAANSPETAPKAEAASKVESDDKDTTGIDNKAEAATTEEDTAHASAPASQVDVVIERKAVEAVGASAAKKMRETTLTPPDEEKFIIAHPMLSAVDQEIMYLTAQYTAMSGKTFLAGLATREQRNPQFDFLKPTHALFAYFTTLVEKYALVLAKEDAQMKRIEDGMDRMKVLDRCVHKMEWMRQEQEKKDREAAEDDAERQAIAQIDWYDFVVVETITFNDDEEAAAAAAATQQETAAENASDDDMDMDMDEDDDEVKPDLKIVQDYVPLASAPAAALSTQPLLSVDGKAVTSAEANEHMRILLMNPKWREETQRHLEKQKETSYAAGTAIADSLRRFATRRADIFTTAAEEQARLEESTQQPTPIQPQPTPGLSEEEEMQMQMASEQLFMQPPQQSAPPYAILPPSQIAPTGMRLPPPVNAPGMVPAMAPGMMAPGMMAPGLAPPRSGFPPFAAPPMHQGFVPGPPGQVPPMFAPGPPGLSSMPPGIAPLSGPPGVEPPLNSTDGQSHPAFTESEPAAKRQKTEGSGLLTEEEFAALHPGSLRLAIKIPDDADNAQWKLKGQTLQIELDVMDSIRVLKEKLMNELGGMPINKQQLKAPVGFLKDSLTCAHYNFVSGTTLDFTVRQRGGRR